MLEDFDLSVCCIKGCDNPSIALGLCTNHWRRNRKYGSPVALKTHAGQFRGMTPEERFAKQVRKTDVGCWSWAGSKDKDGYAIFKGHFGGIAYNKAHRFSYALHTGEDPALNQVCHTCDNPQCCNPDHLFLGTSLDNMRDKIAKGRARVARGEDGGHAKLTEEQAKAIIVDARSYAVIADEYGVSPSTVGNVKNRDSWGHLDGQAVKAKRVSPRKGVSDRITPEIVRIIRAKEQRAMDLATRFGISRQLVCDIQKRRSWAHVED